MLRPAAALVGGGDRGLEGALALGGILDRLELAPHPSFTAPSSPIAPNSDVGQATVNCGALKLPAAIAWAPSP